MSSRTNQQGGYSLGTHKIQVLSKVYLQLEHSEWLSHVDSRVSSKGQEYFLSEGINGIPLLHPPPRS